MKKQRMKGELESGKCDLCGGTFGKAAMTKHLGSCMKRELLPKETSASGISGKRRTFHIMVEGHHLPEYWLHISADADATLEDLDDFLRDTWLECCGHMSAFTIRDARYIAGAGIDSMWMAMGFVPGGQEMSIALGKVLYPKMKFFHEYDFGTTTKLALKVVSEHEGAPEDRPIRILARNEPPQIRCDICGKIAVSVCGACGWSGEEGWLCDGCARKHKCGEDALLPVVNSPRVGVCGYWGKV